MHRFLSLILDDHSVSPKILRAVRRRSRLKVSRLNAHLYSSCVCRVRCPICHRESLDQIRGLSQPGMILDQRQLQTTFPDWSSLAATGGFDRELLLATCPFANTSHGEDDHMGPPWHEEPRNHRAGRPGWHHDSARARLDFADRQGPTPTLMSPWAILLQFDAVYSWVTDG
jgi:hypothetical protein